MGLKIKIKSVAYSSQGSHTGQIDFCMGLHVKTLNISNIVQYAKKYKDLTSISILRHPPTKIFH